MSQPHGIFIITDQQRFDTIRSLGYDYVDTPNLDRLVTEGVTFTDCHITAPSCAPSRVSLFTGYYPHTTGILRNADRWEHSWIEQLQECGYRTINVGKMHTYPYHTPLGFEERYVVENKDRYLEERFYFDEWDKALRARGLVKQQRELYRQRPDYDECLGAFTWDLPADTHPDNFVGDMVTWWIRTKPKDERPLFLEVGFPGPHPPYDPTPDFAEKYMQREFPLLTVTEEELEGQPEAFKRMWVHNKEVDHDSIVHLLDPTHEQRHRQRAYYMANVEMIDQKVGEILEALEEKGYLEAGFLMVSAFEGDGRVVRSDDLNNDGRQDLILVEVRSEPSGNVAQTLRVFANKLETSNHWIGIRLREAGPHFSPIGVRVIVRTSTGQQVDAIVTGDSLYSQHSCTVHFGLGKSDRIEAIEVRWPDGTTRKLENPETDKYHLVDPPNAIPPKR